jgi:tetratricopeptide (TPR) repeat protein
MNRWLLSCAAALLALPLASQAKLSDAVRTLRSDWAHIKYQLPADQQADAYAKLADRAATVVQAQPGEAEPLIWDGIILASEAGAKGGLSALGLVKQARDLLQKAEAIDAKALDGSVYTSLGSLYYQVPGWPIGFGDDDKARDYLKKALAVDPNGIDANFFYAGYLEEQGDDKAALRAYRHALQAPPRPDRPLADSGRRHEIELKIAALQKQLAD